MGFNFQWNITNLFNKSRSINYCKVTFLKRYPKINNTKTQLRFKKKLKFQCDIF